MDLNHQYTHPLYSLYWVIKSRLSVSLIRGTHTHTRREQTISGGRKNFWRRLCCINECFKTRVLACIIKGDLHTYMRQFMANQLLLSFEV